MHVPGKDQRLLDRHMDLGSTLLHRGGCNFMRVRVVGCVCEKLSAEFIMRHPRLRPPSPDPLSQSSSHFQTFRLRT